MGLICVYMVPSPSQCLSMSWGPGQAVENVAEVLANVLRTKSRLEITMEKLREIRSDESTS